MTIHTTDPTNDERRHSKRKSFIIVAAALVAILVAVLLVNAFGGNSAPKASADLANGQTSPSSEPSVSPDFEQCRVDAVMAYMQAQGFEDGDFVIGEDNIDTSVPEFSKTGSLGFGKDGMIVDSRAALQGVFDSSDENLQAVANAQTSKFPELDEEVILDAENWEIVQSTVPVQIQGNTGFSNGNVVDMGTRNSAAGDAGWLFIDTELCTVPTASHTAAGELVSSTTPDNQKPVGFIRVGCINPGDGFMPPPPPPPPPTTPPTNPPPPPPPTNEPKDPAEDPYPRGNAPIGGGPNADPGPGTYIPPQEMEQPPAAPRVDPPPPAPEPAPAPPTVTPSPAPATPPTVDTGEQDNDGTVPEEGGANCNPDFQNCP